MMPEPITLHKLDEFSVKVDPKNLTDLLYKNTTGRLFDIKGTKYLLIENACRTLYSLGFEDVYISDKMPGDCLIWVVISGMGWGRQMDIEVKFDYRITSEAL